MNTYIRYSELEVSGSKSKEDRVGDIAVAKKRKEMHKAIKLSNAEMKKASEDRRTKLLADVKGLREKYIEKFKNNQGEAGGGVTNPGEPKPLLPELWRPRRLELERNHY